MTNDPRAALIRDLGLLLTGSQHRSVQLGPTARHAAGRILDALPLDGVGGGVTGADDVAAVITAALDDPSLIRVPAWTGTVPPPDVLARPITVQDVQQWPDYFIAGPGRDIADRTRCGHGYTLTSSCPVCP